MIRTSGDAEADAPAVVALRARLRPTQRLFGLGFLFVLSFSGFQEVSLVSLSFVTVRERAPESNSAGSVCHLRRRRPWSAVNRLLRFGARTHTQRINARVPPLTLALRLAPESRRHGSHHLGIAAAALSRPRISESAPLFGTKAHAAPALAAPAHAPTIPATSSLLFRRNVLLYHTAPRFRRVPQAHFTVSSCLGIITTTARSPRGGTARSPLAPTHGPAAEALYEGAEYATETGSTRRRPGWQRQRWQCGHPQGEDTRAARLALPGNNSYASSKAQAQKRRIVRI